MSKNFSGRLPVEILAEILSQTAGRVELNRHQRRCAASESHSPWDLAMVCKYWQDVIFSTLCMWSNISLEVTHKEIAHMCNALLSSLKCCLDRSGDHPLTIELITSKREPPKMFPVFIKSLMEHVHRWETVTFCASLDALLSYLSTHSIQYTRLRCLCIDNNFDVSKENWTGLFQDAPLLSSLSLRCLPCHCQRLGGVGISWSQISHLRIDIEFGRLDDLFDILQNTSNLITLDCSVWHSYSGAEELPILELSHLQQIVWTSPYDASLDADGPATSQFFRLLKAPQLSVLEVNSVCGDEEVEAIRDCLQRSKCSITYLDLSTPCLASLLSLTPDIETLVFTKVPFIIDDDGVKCDDFGDGPLCDFELARLRKIKILLEDRNNDCPATSQFFEHLRAPQLSELELNGVFNNRELETIRGCLQRSKCSVTYLKFPISPPPSLLSLAPDVETLVLPSFDEEDLKSVFGGLALDYSAGSCLFPKLKKIVLSSYIPAGPLFDAFIYMLKSRLQESPNSSVTLQCDSLRELEFRIFFELNDMRQRIYMRLTSQEHLVITHVGWGHLYDAWDF